jgi:transposase
LAEKRSEWVLGYQDEVWGSRLAQPALQSWADGEPLRLTELTVEKSDPEPKALACYGLLRADTGQSWLRFVQGRPLAVITTRFLAWVCERLQAAGKKALLLIGDNASWHLSHAVREWIKRHNLQAKREGGVRILRCQLPTKSPWLNRIEPHWVHGKHAIVEPTRTLTANELIERVCDYYGAEHFSHLSK